MRFVRRWFADWFTPVPSIASALAEGEEVLFEAKAHYPIKGSYGDDHDVLVVLTSSYTFLNSAVFPQDVAHAERMIRIPLREIQQATLKRLRGFERLSSGGFSEVVTVATKDGRSRELFFHESEKAQRFCQLINER